MSNRRPLAWNAVVTQLKADRAAVVPSLAGIRAMAQCYSRTNKRPLFVAGRFDRAAIMTCATLAAKDHQRMYGSTWTEALSVALKATWQAARVVRLSSAH